MPSQSSCNADDRTGVYRRWRAGGEIRMPTLKITSTSEDSKTVETKEGGTLMEAIRDNGFGDLLALCGGGCSCGTCHVYVDEGFADRIPPMSSDENDLLDVSEHRRKNSRLACQIKVTAALDGAAFTVAQQE
jgi:ferredoxin, 2Fe-2S